ncbi:LLM class flavin-dependent oxidoreductase [Streptomyces fagopyri]|uniref:LLM class flavin-dependent oxidoreductase n=1 Tax=Streptomyces fagopyri TaxID=2662397 RepID=A0A5Q0L5L6_9ACTN|nr:LLM class flavin-dependent oxidoreductase [Streptomyces fagopyri]QFZ72340.1 LLM class flavin-dependent oxidoreductase [Streptomyces fagopyri]
MPVHGEAVRFGVHSGQQNHTFGESLELWQRAEALGYQWASVFDHFRPPLGGPGGPCLDGMTLLAALAARTSRIRCALLVSAPTWRHPAVAAVMAATIDHISGGRLEFGLGAAGPDLGYTQYGIPFPPAGARMDLLDEACRVTRALWTEEVSDFSGRYVQLSSAHLAPKPVQPRIPLVIGGDGERRLLRIVAEHADIWNTLAGTPESYRRKCEALARHCAAVGRAPEEIRRSVTFRAVLAEDEREARARKAELLRRLPADSPLLDEYVTFGTPEQCVADLLRFRELGVTDFVLGVRPPIDWQTVELVARHVMPAVASSPPPERYASGTGAVTAQ